MRREGHESLGMQAGRDAGMNRPTQARTALISASISSEQAPLLTSSKDRWDDAALHPNP